MGKKKHCCVPTECLTICNPVTPADPPPSKVNYITVGLTQAISFIPYIPFNTTVISNGWALNTTNTPLGSIINTSGKSGVYVFEYNVNVINTTSSPIQFNLIVSGGSQILPLPISSVSTVTETVSSNTSVNVGTSFIYAVAVGDIFQVGFNPVVPGLNVSVSSFSVYQIA